MIRFVAIVTENEYKKKKKSNAKQHVKRNKIKTASKTTLEQMLSGLWKQISTYLWYY